MASLVRRGTRVDPVWHVKWNVVHADGTTGQKWKRLDGIRDLKAARQRLSEIALALQKGEDPFPTRIEPTAARHLLHEWAGLPKEDANGRPARDENGNPLLDETGKPAQWPGHLRNRSAISDRGVVRKHLVPRLGHLTLEQITVHEVLDWIEEMRTAGTYSGQTQKHALTMLSRFWGWCVVQRRTALPNPVRSVPMEARPVVVHKKRATLEDEGKLAELIANLPPPVGLMLALCNRSGMRLGEVCGLRISDLDDMDRGFIRVAHSYGGPLKEDKKKEGKSKKSPAPIDAREALKSHLALRRDQGAKDDDLLFVPSKPPRRKRITDWAGFRKENIRDLWRAAAGKVGLAPSITWYGASRTSMATRAAKLDVSAQEIGDALGHANPEVTREHYIQHTRENFAEALRLPMGPLLSGGSGGSVAPASAPAAKKVRAAKPK